MVMMMWHRTLPLLLISLLSLPSPYGARAAVKQYPPPWH